MWHRFFVKLITKNYDTQYRWVQKTLYSDIKKIMFTDVTKKKSYYDNLDINLEKKKLDKNLSGYKIYNLFMHALIEKIPKDILTNDLINPLIKNSSPDDLDFIVFVNNRGLEFNAKNMKLLKDAKFDLTRIKFNDINMNIKKFNSQVIIESIFENSFEECKKKFYDMLKDNKIESNQISLVFNEINNFIQTLNECPLIENIIKLKLYYEEKITEHDIYLFALYHYYIV